LTALGVELARARSQNVYEVRLSSQQVGEVTALPFVAGVQWLSPVESAPRVAPQAVTPGTGSAMGIAPPAAAPLPFDVSLHDPADRPKIEQWLADRGIEILGTGARKIRISVAADDAVLGE